MAPQGLKLIFDTALNFSSLIAPDSQGHSMNCRELQMLRWNHRSMASWVIVFLLFVGQICGYMRLHEHTQPPSFSTPHHIVNYCHEACPVRYSRDISVTAPKLHTSSPPLIITNNLMLLVSFLFPLLYFSAYFRHQAIFPFLPLRFQYLRFNN